MTTHTHPKPFRRSRSGIALLVFLGFAVVLLVAEHWAHVAGIFPFVLLLVLCGMMHLFMHGHGPRGH